MRSEELADAELESVSAGKGAVPVVGAGLSAAYVWGLARQVRGRDRPKAASDAATRACGPNGCTP